MTAHPTASAFFDLCLAVDDVKPAKRFWEALGFEVTVDSDEWVHLSNGALEISLMTFLDQNLVNLRGADLAGAYEALAAAGLAGDTQPESYTAEEMGSAGSHWTVTDPTGSAVYFDTTEPESEPATKVTVLLRQVEQRLANLGIESEHFIAFRDELRERFDIAEG